MIEVLQRRYVIEYLEQGFDGSCYLKINQEYNSVHKETAIHLLSHLKSWAKISRFDEDGDFIISLGTVIRP